MQILPATYHAAPVPAEHFAWLEEVSRLQLRAFLGSPFDCWQHGEYLVMQRQATAFADDGPPAWTISQGSAVCLRVTTPGDVLARIEATAVGQVSFYQPEHQELYRQLSYYRGGPWFLEHARSVQAWLTVKPGDTISAFGGVYVVERVEEAELLVRHLEGTACFHLARYGIDRLYQPGDPWPMV